MAHFVATTPAPMVVAELGAFVASVERGGRAAYLQKRMGGAPPRAVVRVLSCAIRTAALGDLNARILLDAAEDWLGSIDQSELRLAAVELDDEAVLRLTSDDVGGPALVIPIRGSLAANGESLGRRKSLARTAKGDELDRLLIDQNASVIAELLRNPRLTELQVIGIAARKKVGGDVLKEIADSAFGRRPRVRRALVQNPSCPLSAAVRLLPALVRGDIIEIAHNEHLSDELRGMARLLLAR